MATQVIQTKFISSGANKVAADTQRIGKEQTRLGQASASAGREFSAQANGLGGLVGAYAGAAANIFAITAAFVALKRAAEFDVIIAGTNALASSIGSSGEKILNSVQEITKGQLSLLETAQTVNIGLAAGFNTTQIDQLTEVSLRASKALGRSLTDAFTRVSRGAAKLEPELLDELGIFTRIDPAVQKYADSVGRSASSLTNFERRQAFVNAVIEEGTQKFRDVDVNTSTAAESFERLSATIINLGLQVGSLLATGLAPLADFISGNLSNALAGFGLLASVVGARAVSALSAGILSATGAIVNLGTKSATAINSLNKNFKNASAELIKFNNANNLAVRSNSQLAQSINQKLIVVQADIAAGRLKTAAELANAQAVIQSAIAEGRAAFNRSKNIKSKNLQLVALRNLTRENLKLTAAINASSGASNLATIGFNSLSKGVGIFGTILSSVVSKLLSFVTFVSLAQIALDGLAKVFGFEGFSILEGILNVLKKVVEFFTKITREVKGLASSFKTELQAAANSAGAFGEDSEKAIKTATDTFTRYVKAVAQARQVIERGGFGQTGDPSKAIQGAFEDIIDPILTATDESKRFAAAVLTRLFELVAEFGVAESAVVNLAATFSILREASGTSANAISDFLRGIRGIEGITLKFDKDTAVLSATIGDLTRNFQKVEKDGTLSFKKGFQDIAATLSIAADKINDFDEGLKNGTLNAEKAAQAVGAIGSTINDLDEQNKKLDRLIQDNERVAKTTKGVIKENAELAITELKQAKEVLAVLRDRLKVQQVIRDATAGNIAALEKQAKLFDKVFGKPGEKIDRAIFEGTLTSDGFAPNQAEKDLNRVRKLTNLILEGNNAQKGQRDTLNRIKNLSTEIRKDNEKLVSTNEAILGFENAGVTETQKFKRLKSEQLAIAERIKGSQEFIAMLEKELKVRSSESAEAIKLKNLAVQQSVLEQENLLKIAANTLKLEKEASQVSVKNFNLIQKQIELEERATKRINDARIKADQQRLENQQKVLDGLGLLNASGLAAFQAAGASLEIERAKSDRDFEKGQIDRREKIEDNKRIADLELFNKEIEIRKAEIQNTLLLINAIQNLSLIIDNAERTAAGLDRRQTLPGFINTKELEDRTEAAFSTIENITKDNFAKQKKIIEDEANLKRNTADDTFNEIKNRLQSESTITKFFADQSVQVFLGISDVVRNNLKTSFEEFFDAIAEGTLTLSSFKERFIETLKTTFDDVRKIILEETLIKPAQERATKFLAGAFGFDLDTKPAVVSTGEGAAQLVKIAGQEGSDSELKKLLQEGVGGEKGFFDQIFEKLKTGFSDFGSFIGDTFSSLGTSIRSIFSGITNSFSGGGGSSILGGIFSGVRGIFSGFGGGAPSTIYDFSPGSPFASGGSVQKFANGGMMRDRVPALLEPGEFVVRRQAAKVAGVGNLAALNATGQMGGGNVSVNVTNTGTPQEATASPPRFDGEKMVIDIVMRDLSNNGPIRKTLRAGGAG